MGMREIVSINDIRTAIRELSARANLARKEGRFDDAEELEQRIQGWSRAKREALIRGEYGVLPRLSQNATKRRREREARGAGPGTETGFDDGR